MINHNWSYEITALNLSIITTSRPLFQFLWYLQLIIFFANSKHCFSQYLAIRNLPTSDGNRIVNSVPITGNIHYYINFYPKYQVS